VGIVLGLTEPTPKVLCAIWNLDCLTGTWANFHRNHILTTIIMYFCDGIKLKRERMSLIIPIAAEAVPLPPAERTAYYLPVQ